jgi:hypothetical protein
VTWSHACVTSQGMPSMTSSSGASVRLRIADTPAVTPVQHGNHSLGAAAPCCCSFVQKQLSRLEHSSGGNSCTSSNSRSYCCHSKQRCSPRPRCSTPAQGCGPGVPAAHGSTRASRCPAGGRSCRSLWPGTHTLRQWPAQVQRRQWPMQTPAVAIGRVRLAC